MPYSEIQPHDSLNDLTPWEYLALHNKPEEYNLGFFTSSFVQLMVSSDI